MDFLFSTTSAANNVEKSYQRKPDTIYIIYGPTGSGKSKSIEMLSKKLKLDVFCIGSEIIRSRERLLPLLAEYIKSQSLNIVNTHLLVFEDVK